MAKGNVELHSDKDKSKFPNEDRILDDFFQELKIIPLTQIGIQHDLLDKLRKTFDLSSIDKLKQNLIGLKHELVPSRQ